MMLERLHRTLLSLTGGGLAVLVCSLLLLATAGQGASAQPVERPCETVGGFYGPGIKWYSTLTVEATEPPELDPQNPDAENYGYQDDSGGRTSYGSLSNSSFTYDGTSYTVKAVSWDYGGDTLKLASLRLELDPALDDGLVLHVDTHEYNVPPFMYALDDNDGTDSATGEVTWDALFPALDDGDTVTLRLGSETETRGGNVCRTFLHQSEQNQIRNVRAVLQSSDFGLIQWERRAYNTATNQTYEFAIFDLSGQRVGGSGPDPDEFAEFIGGFSQETVYVVHVSVLGSSGGLASPVKIVGLWSPGPGGL